MKKVSRPTLPPLGLFCLFLNIGLTEASKSSASAPDRGAGMFHRLSREHGPDKAKYDLTDIGKLLIDIKTDGPRMSESISELNAAALEGEIIAGLDMDVAQCRKSIQEGLVSNNLTDQAISLMAQAKYVEAEQKSIASAGKNVSQSMEAAVFDYRLAASACFFRKEYRSMMDHCHAALKIAPQERAPLLWGTLQIDLGDAMRLLARTEKVTGDELWIQASRAYEAAAEINAREISPKEWAIIQRKLSRTLSERAENSQNSQRGNLLAQAVTAAQGALEVFNLDEFPDDYANTHFNLGNIYLIQANGLNRSARDEKNALIDKGIGSFRSALAAVRFSDYPSRWASLHQNLAIALMRRATGQQGGDGIKSIYQAIEANSEAHKFYTREDRPHSWAEVHHNLGLAFRMMATGQPKDRAVPLLQGAMQHYRDALEIYTREAFPQDWATTQVAAGRGFEDLAMQMEDTERTDLLKEAEKSYESALEIWTSSDQPDSYREALGRLEKVREKLKATLKTNRQALCQP
ncbi:MAG: hypothetical protein V4675_03255 [Verrucomicrobiota bacterium]